MNELWFRLKKILMQYREWLVIALLLLVCLYFLMKFNSLEEDQVRAEILSGLNRMPVSEGERLDYKKIIEKIINVPDPYRELVRLNPFEPIEIKRERMSLLKEKYDTAQGLFRRGSYLDAEKVFREILEMDPFMQKIDYKPLKPDEYIERCQEEHEKQLILAEYRRGIDLYERAKSVDVPGGGAGEEELLRIYEDSEKALGAVVERGETAVPNAWADAREKLQEVRERVVELELATFVAQITSWYEDAVSLWNQRSESLVYVADAMDNLKQIIQRIENYPGEQLPAQAQSIQEQASQMMGLIEEEADQRVPVVLEQAETLAEEGRQERDISKLNKSLELFETVQRLRPDEIGEDTLVALRGQIDELAVELALQRGQEWLEQARQALSTAKQQLSAGEYDQAETTRDNALTVVQQVEALPELPDLQPIKAEVARIGEELEAITIPQPITGVQLISARNARQAIVQVEGVTGNVFLRSGREDIRTGLEFTRVGQTDERGEIVSIYVKKEGFRETLVTKEEEGA
jgi:tetratricopeptide (TPR) repeat protein